MCTDLSLRTQGYAPGLEETAACLEQIRSAMPETAGSFHAGGQLAGAAPAARRRGQQQVQ